MSLFLKIRFLSTIKRINCRQEKNRRKRLRDSYSNTVFRNGSRLNTILSGHNGGLRLLMLPPTTFSLVLYFFCDIIRFFWRGI